MCGAFTHPFPNELILVQYFDELVNHSPQARDLHQLFAQLLGHAVLALTIRRVKRLRVDPLLFEDPVQCALAAEPCCQPATGRVHVEARSAAHKHARARSATRTHTCSTGGDSQNGWRNHLLRAGWGRSELSWQFLARFPAPMTGSLQGFVGTPTHACANRRLVGEKMDALISKASVSLGAGERWPSSAPGPFDRALFCRHHG